MSARIVLALVLVLAWVSTTWAGTATLSWQDNSGNNCTVTVCDQEDGFEVHQALNSAPYAKVATVGTNITTAIIPGLVAGDTACFKVLAFNVTGQSGFSNEACKTFTAPDETITIALTLSPAAAVATVFINFQPAAAALPPGYTKDDGAPYSAAQRYGWNRDLRGQTRDRNVNPDQRLDTLIFADTGQIVMWEYDLPSGTYLISLASGDPSWAHGPHRVEVEGIVVIDNIATAVNAFITRTDVPVVVNDGKLTVKLTAPTSGNQDTMLNYLIIKVAP